MSLPSVRLEERLEWSTVKRRHSQGPSSHCLRAKRQTQARTKVSKHISAIRSPAEQRPLRTDRQHLKTPAPRSAPKRETQPQPSPPPRHSPQQDESEAQPLPLFRTCSGIPRQRLYVLSAREVYLTQRTWKGRRCVYLQAPRSAEREVSVHKYESFVVCRARGGSWTKLEGKGRVD